jgi:heterodisulfide reductase subunit C
MNINTIKSKVKKQFQAVEIKEVKKHKWNLFSVKVTKEMARSTKIGMIFGEWNCGECTMEKIEWI